MKQTGASALVLAVSLTLVIAPATHLRTAGNETPSSPCAPLLGATSSATILMPGRRAWAEGADYRAQYTEEYAFFKAAFDESNGNDFGAERDLAFSIVTQKVEALQKTRAKISLGGMLSLLIWEGGARLAHYNTLCSENSYYKNISGCWNYPMARYSYQLGLGVVHTSRFYPCSKLEPLSTRANREKFAQLARQAGFSPTAEQLASVAGELHQFCPAGTQPLAVDYYILRVHDLGIPKDKKGNALASAGKSPFFVPSLSLEFFFSPLEAQPSQLTSDEKAICIWGNADYYCTPRNQATILARWNQFRTSGRTRPNEGCGPVGSRAPQEVVLADLLMSNDGKEFVLAPFVIYAQSQYVPLPNGTDILFERQLTREDFLPDGVNQNSQPVITAKKRSILNKFKNFGVFRKGKRVGCFSVKEIVVAQVGGLKVVGRGTSVGFQPQNGDIGVVGPASHSGFWSPTVLSFAQQQQLLSQALAMIPKTVPADWGRQSHVYDIVVAPQLVGKPIIIGQTRVSANVLDVRRDGRTEIFFNVNAEMKTSFGPFTSGDISLLESYDERNGSWKRMLGCRYSWELQTFWNNGCGLFDVVDINGDGIAELILNRGHGEVGDIEIYELNGGQLRLIFAIRGWTGS